MTTTELKGNVKLCEDTDTVLTINKPITPNYTYPIAVGKIGQIISGTKLIAEETAYVTATGKKLSTIILTKGTWMVTATNLSIVYKATTNPAEAATNISFYLNYFELNTTPLQYYGVTQSLNQIVTGTANVGIGCNSNAIVTISADSQALSLVTEITFTGKAPTVNYFAFNYSAVRIA